MKEPLNQFADRIIRNDEVKEFIQGLIEKGVRPETIVDAAKPEPKDTWKIGGRHHRFID